jgi:hypothetical protein
MDFVGFVNSDFDFFKKKTTMDKQEYDERKEEVKRHFREFCYQVQKCYHLVTGGTLVLDKDFQGLNRNRNSITAKSQVYGFDIMEQVMEMNQDKIFIYFVCPKSDGNSADLQVLKNLIEDKKDIFSRFFKENKEVSLALFSRHVKKAASEDWIDECKFDNSELSLGDYKILVSNIEKLQSQEVVNKIKCSIRIRTQFSKNDIIRTGKAFAERSCGEIIKLQNLCNILQE